MSIFRTCTLASCILFLLAGCSSTTIKPLPVEGDAVQFSDLPPSEDYKPGDPGDNPPSLTDRWRVSLKGFEGVEQENATLCWAACIVSVETFQGRQTLPQSELHERFVLDFPDQHSNDASPEQVLYAMSPDFKDQYQGRYVLDADSRAILSPGQIALELSAGYPVIVGLLNPEGFFDGHAVVLYQADYAQVDQDTYEMLLREGKSIWDQIASLGGESDEPGQRIRHRSPWEELIVDSPDYRERFYAFDAVKIWDPYPHRGHIEMDGAAFIERMYFALSTRTAEQLAAERIQWLDRHAQNKLGVYVRRPLDDEPFAYVEFDPFKGQTNSDTN